MRSIAPDKPYFLYMSTGATHAPHHASPEFVARFKGQFDDGWDAYRQKTFENQKRLGVVPANTVLTPRPKELPAWDSLTADQKRLYARMMEVYAGFLTHTDAEVGRLADFLDTIGELDNTIFIVMSDNGASAEGGPQGIRVHAISPGPLATRAASGIPEFDELLAKAKLKAPSRELVGIDDVGIATAFLAHDAARLITGQVLYVDGGYHIVD